MHKLTIALALTLALAAGSTATAKPYNTDSAMWGQAYASEAGAFDRQPNPADFGN